MEAMLAQSGEFDTGSSRSETTILRKEPSCSSSLWSNFSARNSDGRSDRELRPDQRKPEQFPFYLFNLFAGRFGETRRFRKQILLPLAPEYIGYSEVGLEKDFFQANRPEITRLDNNLFKYQVDFDSLKINEQTGAVCFSRPTNPTGNVVTDEEVERLKGRNAKASPSSSTMPTARPSPTSSTRASSRFGTRT